MKGHRARFGPSIAMLEDVDESWDAEKLQELGFDKETLLNEAEEFGEDSRRDAKVLFAGFLDVVRRRHE